MLTLCVLLLSTPCSAGVFLEGQAGGSYLLNTAPDGLWQQQAFGTSYQGIKLSYGIRMGWQFEAPYSVQAGALSFGTGRLETNAVADSCYNPHTHTVSCGTQTMHLKTANSMRGYTLSATRYLAANENWSIPISVGVALVTARLRADDTSVPQYTQERYSRMPMGSLGVGVCWRGVVCWDNTFYAAVQGQHYHDPLSTQVFTSLIGVRYTFH